MNLFRAEEHIRNWVQYNPDSEQGIIALDDLVKLFSCELFRRRLEPGYFSRRQQYVGEFWAILREMAKKRPFWFPPNL